MAKSGRERLRGERRAVGLFALVLVCAAAAVVLATTGGARRRSSSSSSHHNGGAQEEGPGQRLDISLRSFTPRASGHLTIEADRRGGRGRLTALNLPDPQTLSRAARTFVVWATSEGRFLRLGELRRDERGNGGLAFTHPAEFERYTVLVTAESSAEPERPAGAPVLSTRAGEAHAVYLRTTDESNASPGPTDTPTAASPPRERRASTSRSQRATGDFYAEVDDALDAQGGGRALLLEGDAAVAPRAEGQARATAADGRGYVRVRFRGLPLPTAAGANTYVMWAIVPDGRIVYMGSLPATEELNHADIYVRTAGFETDDFELFVTAEMRRLLYTPSERRALSTRKIRSTVK